MAKLNQHGAIQFIILIILIAGLIAGLYLVQKTQIFKPKATVSGTRIEVVGPNVVEGKAVSRNVKLKLVYVPPTPTPSPTPTPTPSPSPSPSPTPSPTPTPSPSPSPLPQISFPSGFSTTQGLNSLYYLGYVKASNEYKEARWNGSQWNVDGSDRNFRIDSNSLAPSWNVHSVIRWVVQQSGSITINGSFTRCCTEAGDANISPHTIYFVKKNSEQLWTQNTDDQTPRSFNLSTTVSSGDKIEFWVDANNDSGWDASSLSFNITYNTLGISVALAQEVGSFPTHFRVSNDRSIITSAPEQQFIGDPTEIDWQLTEGNGTKTVYVQFKVNGFWSPIYSVNIQLEETAASPTPTPTPSPSPSPSPCPAAQTCPTTCHADSVRVPDGSCGETVCPGNAPAAGTCPTACGQPATTMPDGRCGTTNCPATRSCLDLNGDGQITLSDISLYFKRDGVDLDGDGTINNTDLNQLFQAWISGGRKR